MCTDRRSDIAGEVDRSISVVLTPTASRAGFRQRGECQSAVTARVVAEYDCWDAVGRVAENERPELGIPGRGPEVGLDGGPILVHVGGEFVAAGGVGNRRAEPEPSVFVVIPSIHEVTRVLTRRDRSRREHDGPAVGSVHDVAPEADIATLEAVEKFKHSCAAVGAGRPRGVIHPTYSPRL